MVTNYAEWKAAVAAEHKQLFEVSHYLNENGEERKRVFSTLTSRLTSARPRKSCLPGMRAGRGLASTMWPP